MEKPAKIATSPIEVSKEAAYLRGYNDCKKSNAEKKSSMLDSAYAPVPSYESEYKAGWDKAQSEVDKKTVRGGGVVTLVLGAFSIIGGLWGVYICLTMASAGVLPTGLLVLAAIFVLSGLGILIKGLVAVISGRDTETE